MFRGQGVQVATVDTAGKVRLRTVKVGRNFGETVELLEGITGADRVVLNPSDSIADGDEVSIVRPEPPAEEPV